MSQKTRISVYAGFGVIILTGLLLRWNYPPQPELAVLGELPDFRLIDQSGNSFGRANLTGKVWVADFIFTTCAGPCPIMSSQFTELQDRFSHLPYFRLLSISVNPEYDTPQVLTEYGDRYNADHSRWSFLTGDREAIHKLAVDGFHVGSVEDPVFHSTRFILVDRDGQIRGYYISSEMDEMKKLWRDVERLAEST